MGRRKRMQHVLISANKGVVSLFLPPLFCVRVPREKRGVGFLRCFCLVANRMVSWETRVGRWRSNQQHQVSRCFLRWCLLFVCLQDKSHGHHSLSLLYCGHFFLFFPSLCSPSSVLRLTSLHADRNVRRFCSCQRF